MKEKINLYVDDLRDCPEGFMLARNYEQAKHYFQDYEIGTLSIDHDLGADEKGNLLPSGYDLVKYFCEKGFRADKIYLHTNNVVGRENMYSTLIWAQNNGLIDKDIIIYNYPLVHNKYSDK
jgi:hypothetical protein